MYVAINPYSKYVYRNMAIHINVTCICIHICLTRSLKNPYQGQFNINCENCYLYTQQQSELAFKSMHIYIYKQRRLDKQAAKDHGYECLIARVTSLILWLLWSEHL